MAIKDRPKTQHEPVAPADIPTLKKKEEERKKAGVAWGGGAPGGAPFSGATGGAGTFVVEASATAAARTAIEAAQAAGAQAGGSFLARLIAALASTTLGKLALGLAATLLLLGAGIYGAGLFGFDARLAPGMPGILGAVHSTIKVPGTSGPSSVGYASQGNLKLDEPQKPVEPPVVPPAPPEAPKVEQAEAPKTVDWGDILTAGFTTERLAHNLPGAQLSKDLGKQFGNTNVSANMAAPKFGDGFNRDKIASFSNARPLRTNLKPMTRQASVGKYDNVTHRKAFSSRAMGQLKFARVLSQGAASATGGEVVKTMAADAWDGAVTGGGSPPKGLATIPPPTNVNPMGGGAPDVTNPADVAATDDAPYQNLMDAAKNKMDQAGKNQMMGMILMLLGAAILAISTMLKKVAAYLKAHPPLAAAVLIIAIALMVMGMMIQMQGQKKKDQAQQDASDARRKADELQKLQHQKDQAKILKECTDQALAHGTSASACRPSTGAPNFNTTVKPDAEREGTSTYDLEGGAPLPPRPPL